MAAPFIPASVTSFLEATEIFRENNIYFDGSDEALERESCSEQRV